MGKIVKEKVLEEVEEWKREKKPIIDFIMNEDKHDSGFWFYYPKDKERAFNILAGWILKYLKKHEKLVREDCEKEIKRLKFKMDSYDYNLQKHLKEIQELRKKLKLLEKREISPSYNEFLRIQGADLERSRIRKEVETKIRYYEDQLKGRLSDPDISLSSHLEDIIKLLKEFLKILDKEGDE